MVNSALWEKDITAKFLLPWWTDNVGSQHLSSWMGRGLAYLKKGIVQEVLNIVEEVLNTEMMPFSASEEAARLTERQFSSQHCHQGSLQRRSSMTAHERPM